MSNISKSKKWVIDSNITLVATVYYATQRYTIAQHDGKPIREEEWPVASLAALNTARTEIADWVAAELAPPTPPTP